MDWIYVIGFLPAFFYALTNIIDEHLVNNHFEKVSSILFYSNITNLLFVPVLFLFYPAQFPTFNSFIYISIIALFEILYLYPYYSSLKHIDTSIVSSLFSLTKIILPVLAFIFLGEKISLNEYIGFFIIVFSSIALSFNPQSKLKINKAFFYMLLSSLLITLEGVLYKKALVNTDWVNVFFWTMLLSTLFLIPIILKRENKEDIKNTFPNIRKSYKLFFLNEVLQFFGRNSYIIGATLIPLVILEGFMSVQPFFVLIFAFLLFKFKNHRGRENLDRQEIIRKSICFALIVFGIVITLI